VLFTCETHFRIATVSFIIRMQDTWIHCPKSRRLTKCSSNDPLSPQFPHFPTVDWLSDGLRDFLTANKCHFGPADAWIHPSPGVSPNRTWELSEVAAYKVLLCRPDNWQRCDEEIETDSCLDANLKVSSCKWLGRVES